LFWYSISIERQILQWLLMLNMLRDEVHKLQMNRKMHIE